jgi:hypothetical protein
MRLVIIGLPFPGREHVQPCLPRRLHERLAALSLQGYVQRLGDCYCVCEAGLPGIEIKQHTIRPVQVGDP